MKCTRCDGTGFLNLDQLGDVGLAEAQASGDFHGYILNWIEEQDRQQKRLEGCTCFSMPPCSYCLLAHDVQVCDCCGDGENWHDLPGEHNPNRKPGEPVPSCI